MNKKNKNTKISCAQAVRDVLIVAMDHGQLTTLLFSLIPLSLIYKMPGEKIYDLLKEILNMFLKGQLIAYPLLIVCIFSWAIHVRIIRNQFSREYERIGKEKSDLQRKTSGIELDTSGE